MTQTRFKLLLPAVAVAAVVGCAGCSRPLHEASDGPAPAAAPRQLEPPMAALADGSEITLELALTQEELATGLMFRPKLAPDRGMLLLFPTERYPSIWMKNTLVSLDLVFLDDRGDVVDIVPGVPPCTADPCPTYESSSAARAVLEIAAGGVDGYGIAVGDRLQFERVPGFPVSNPEF